MQYQVDSDWLKEHLEEKNLRVVDCRFKLGDPDAGRNLYSQSHIPGAVYVDLEKDLSGTADVHGGRHPLPNLNHLKERLEESGVDNETTLVAYDTKECAYASRFWWLLKYLGHDKVYILNGGYEAWTKAQYPVDEVIPQYGKTEFIITENPDMLASYEEVKNIAIHGKEDTVLIDSRENNRYLGIEEPIDRIAGHIPTAINKPWMEGLENGYFKSEESQEIRFTGLDKARSIIVYCGSGVTAIPNIIALKKAGYTNVRLYPGSYSDWVSYEDNPVSKGNEGS